MKKVKNDKSFADALKLTKTEDRKKFITDAGFDFTDDELKQAREEISDEELNAVAGGTWHPNCSNDGHCGVTCEKHVCKDTCPVE